MPASKESLEETHPAMAAEIMKDSAIEMAGSLGQKTMSDLGFCEWS